MKWSLLFLFLPQMALFILTYWVYRNLKLLLSGNSLSLYSMFDIFYIVLLKMGVHMYLCTCVSGALGGQKRVLDPLKLKLQTIVSSMWGAGTEFRSSVRTSSLKCWAISPILCIYYCFEGIYFHPSLNCDASYILQLSSFLGQYLILWIEKEKPSIYSHGCVCARVPVGAYVHMSALPAESEALDHLGAGLALLPLHGF